MHKQHEKLLGIDTGFACVTLRVEGNRIVEAPPIFRGWTGRALSSFLAYYKPKTMYEVPHAEGNSSTESIQTQQEVKAQE